ncbi:MAG: PH domain-containing protein [Caulobacterales bacterium]|nr:PH domain-containing protein [Caulobacterales bacterium]
MTIQPSGYLAQVLGTDEQVLLIARPHWLVLLAKTVLWAILVLAVVVSAIWLRVAGSPYWAWTTPLALVPLGFWIWEYQVWSNQMCVLTDRRVIQMDGVLNKQVSDSILDKLNDVKTEQSLLGRIFGYGDIEILTASEEGTNVLHMIQDPLGFKRAMLNAKGAQEDARHSPSD